MRNLYRLVLPFTVVVFFLAVLGWGIIHSPAAHAETFTVTKTDDTNDGNCDEDCSLREAIIAANQGTGLDTIVLGPGTYRLTIGGRAEDKGATGDLDIRGDTILQGSGADQTIIDASGFPSNDPDRVLHIRHTYDGESDPLNPGEFLSAFTPTVTIENVTITGGNSGNAFNNLIYWSGGGVFSEGALTVRSSRFISNTGNAGAGLFQAAIGAATAPLIVENSLFSDNVALFAGGGIGIDNNGLVTITHSTIENNVARNHWSLFGGGLYGMGRITLIATTVRNNRLDRLAGTFYGCHVGDGGGIYLFYGRLTLQDSQVISNSIRSSEPGCSSPSGGGIYADGGDLYLTNTQVMSNTASWSGGISGAGGRIENSIIAYNRADSFNPNTNGDGMTGGITAQDMVIVNSEISHNRAATWGGGIAAGGATRIENSLVAHNQAGFAGGGIRGDFTLIGSTVRDNSAAYGGGISAFGDIKIAQSLIANNTATVRGGGLMPEHIGPGIPIVEITNSTFSGNQAAQGGAIDTAIVTSFSPNVRTDHWSGEINLHNTTVAFNRSTQGSAGILDSGGGIELTIENSLIANNDGDNCTGVNSSASKGHNLSDDGTCVFTSTGDLTKVDAKLGPLQDNPSTGSGQASATMTHALLDGSPAIDAGDDSICPATDQRGVTRPRGAHCDIGAYEYVINKPILRLSTTELTFVGVAGSISPTDQSIQVLNDGTDSFTWNASESIPWLSVDANSGAPSAQVVFSVDSSGLGEGTYTGDVIFSAAGALQSPQTLKVTLRIINAEDLLKNGDFEAGRTGWNESSTQGRALIRQAGDVPHISPHAGSWAAALGQVDGETSELSQQVLLPTGDDLRLHYYAYLHSTESNCTVEIAEVWIGQTRVKEHPLCQSQNSSGWTQHTIDLNAYRGQTVALRFKLRNDALSDPSTFLLDDVSLELAVATPTVTSNFADGAPGSYFTIRAENFPPNAQAMILLNGHQVGMGQTDGNGILQVELDTTGADAGIYIVTVQVNPTATYVLLLDASAPVRSKQGSGAILTVPSGIALTPRLYLPAVTR